MRVLLRLRLGSLPDVVDVRDAPNGRAAIDVAASDPPDVVVLDLQMPVMSGDVALPLLREILPEAYIVVNSAKPRALAPAGVLELSNAYCEKLVDDVVAIVASAASTMSVRPR